MDSTFFSILARVSHEDCSSMINCH